MLIDRHFTETTEEDLVYSRIGNVAINFGYINTKDRGLFLEFLMNNNFISKLTDYEIYQVNHPFMHRAVVPNIKSGYKCVTHMFMQDEHLDSKFLVFEQ
jgi:hypothetical protein